MLNGSYNVFLKIIILCIWYNRICWHALMLEKTHYFSNAIHYCRSFMPRRSQMLSFLQSPSFRQAQSALIGQLTQSTSTSRKCNSDDARMCLQTSHGCVSLSHTREHAHTHTHVMHKTPFEQSIANIKLLTKLKVADSEASDCHSKVRMTSSPRWTKRSSIKCIVITSVLCCAVLLWVILMIPKCIYFQKVK